LYVRKAARKIRALWNGTAVTVAVYLKGDHSRLPLLGFLCPKPEPGQGNAGDQGKQPPTQGDRKIKFGSLAFGIVSRQYKGKQESHARD
jgi:hypothetical protein